MILPNMLALIPMLLNTYYDQNYVSIVGRFVNEKALTPIHSTTVHQHLIITIIHIILSKIKETMSTPYIDRLFDIHMVTIPL